MYLDEASNSIYFSIYMLMLLHQILPSWHSGPLISSLPNSLSFCSLNITEAKRPGCLTAPFIDGHSGRSHAITGKVVSFLAVIAIDAKRPAFRQRLTWTTSRYIRLFILQMAIIDAKRPLHCAAPAAIACPVSCGRSVVLVEYTLVHGNCKYCAMHSEIYQLPSRLPGPAAQLLSLYLLT